MRTLCLTALLALAAVCLPGCTSDNLLIEAETEENAQLFTVPSQAELAAMPDDEVGAEIQTLQLRMNAYSIALTASEELSDDDRERYRRAFIRTDNRLAAFIAEQERRAGQE